MERLSKIIIKKWLVDNCKKIDTFKWSPKGATIKKGSRSVYDDRISVYPKNNIAIILL